MNRVTRLLAVILMIAGFVNVSKADDEKAAEQSLNRSFVYGNFYYHSESRLGVNDISRVSERNLEFSGGFDYLLNPESNLYVGGRAGIYQEQVLTSVPVEPTHSHPFLGGQIYKLFPFEQHLAFKLGGAADLLIVPNGPSAPVWLYAGALGGFRVKFTESFYVEAPIELGITPMFDGTPILTKIGLQLGFAI